MEILWRYYGDTMHEASCMNSGSCFFFFRGNELAKYLFGHDFHGNMKAVWEWETFLSQGVLENWRAL